MASGFGYQAPFTKIRKFHLRNGFHSKNRNMIYATGDGVVYKADASLSGYGNHIEINHGFGYKTLYAHLSKYKMSSRSKSKNVGILLVM